VEELSGAGAHRRQNDFGVRTRMHRNDLQLGYGGSDLSEERPELLLKCVKPKQQNSGLLFDQGGNQPLDCPRLIEFEDRLKG
jgi:hypothetical protein